MSLINNRGTATLAQNVFLCGHYLYSSLTCECRQTYDITNSNHRFPDCIHKACEHRFNLKCFLTSKAWWLDLYEIPDLNCCYCSHAVSKFVDILRPDISTWLISHIWGRVADRPFKIRRHDICPFYRPVFARTRCASLLFENCCTLCPRSPPRTSRVDFLSPITATNFQTFGLFDLLHKCNCRNASNSVLVGFEMKSLFWSVTLTILGPSSASVVEDPRPTIWCTAICLGVRNTHFGSISVMRPTRTIRNRRVKIISSSAIACWTFAEKPFQDLNTHHKIANSPFSADDLKKWAPS